MGETEAMFLSLPLGCDVYSQEDQVGPGAQRNHGGLSCLCRPARQSHPCHHEGLGVPGKEAGRGCQAKAPSMLGMCVSPEDRLTGKRQM